MQYTSYLSALELFHLFGCRSLTPAGSSAVRGRTKDPTVLHSRWIREDRYLLFDWRLSCVPHFVPRGGTGLGEVPLAASRPSPFGLHGNKSLLLLKAWIHPRHSPPLLIAFIRFTSDRFSSSQRLGQLHSYFPLHTNSSNCPGQHLWRWANQQQPDAGAPFLLWFSMALLYCQGSYTHRDVNSGSPPWPKFPSFQLTPFFAVLLILPTMTLTDLPLSHGPSSLFPMSPSLSTRPRSWGSQLQLHCWYLQFFKSLSLDLWSSAWSLFQSCY